MKVHSFGAMFSYCFTILYHIISGMESVNIDEELDLLLAEVVADRFGL